MASLKDVKLKIVGVGKTKQITNAMHMVASAKLRGAQSKIESFRPYADKFQELLGGLAAKADVSLSPLLSVREKPQTAGILLVTSDRGLCGGFNVNLLHKALELTKELQDRGLAVKFYCVGRKGRDAIVKLGFEVVEKLVGRMGSISFTFASGIGTSIINAFLNGGLDEAYVVYAQFVSKTKQLPVSSRLLPIAAIEGRTMDTKSDASEYIYEPDAQTLLGELLPRYVRVEVYRGLLDTAASEHAARMVAMDNATRNCDDITNTLTLLYNKTRQASITTDLMDIVSGAEALNG